MDKHNQAITRIDLSPLGGIAGDMFAASLFSGFPHLYKDFCNDLAGLAIDGLSTCLEDRLAQGLQAKYFSVSQQTSHKPPRTLAEVRDFFEQKNIPESVARHAVGLFTQLAYAEAEVHGKSLETIHFHEVSDWDSVVDILAAAGIIARLNCPLWRVGALPLGGGTVNTAHGDIPIPAPATLALLQGFQWIDDGISGERVTPTGAAILAYLQATFIGDAANPARLIASGSGCGTRQLEGRANLLRMVAFVASEPLPTELLQDEIIRVAFEIDDMTAEEMAWATDELRATDGVLDVSSVSMNGKKNRISTGIRIMVAPNQLQHLIELAFLVTSTIGIRFSTITRCVLDRAEEHVESTSVKRVERPGGVVSAKASSDALESAGSLLERRRRAQAVENECLKAHDQNTTKNNEHNK